ncbi:MAG: Dabb family protein [Microbacteriaceae bacterium]|nr:Dabb family protein [Microbacteriaceae bacterium]
MLHHIVSWQLNGTTEQERATQAQQFVTELTSLKGKISELLHLEVHTNELDIPGNWDVILITKFADRAALEAYAIHPEHQAVVAKIKPLAAARSAVDFTA